jgi:hypothetical protein
LAEAFNHIRGGEDEVLMCSHTPCPQTDDTPYIYKSSYALQNARTFDVGMSEIRLLKAGVLHKGVI